MCEEKEQRTIAILDQIEARRLYRMSEERAKTEALNPLEEVVIEDRIQQQIRHRLVWALTDHREALAKLYALPSLKITPEDRAIWIEITSYLANVESHLVNMLARVPDLFTEEDRRKNREELKQAVKEMTEPPWYLK